MKQLAISILMLLPLLAGAQSSDEDESKFGRKRTPEWVHRPAYHNQGLPEAPPRPSQTYIVGGFSAFPIPYEVGEVFMPFGGIEYNYSHLGMGIQIGKPDLPPDKLMVAVDVTFYAEELGTGAYLGMGMMLNGEYGHPIGKPDRPEELTAPGIVKLGYRLGNERFFLKGEAGYRASAVSEGLYIGLKGGFSLWEARP